MLCYRLKPESNRSFCKLLTLWEALIIDPASASFTAFTQPAPHVKASLVAGDFSAYPSHSSPGARVTISGQDLSARRAQRETRTGETLRWVFPAERYVETGLALIVVVASDRDCVDCIGLEVVICPSMVSLTSGCLFSPQMGDFNPRDWLLIPRDKSRYSHRDTHRLSVRLLYGVCMHRHLCRYGCISGCTHVTLHSYSRVFINAFDVIHRGWTIMFNSILSYSVELKQLVNSLISQIDRRSFTTILLID